MSGTRRIGTKEVKLPQHMFAIPQPVIDRLHGHPDALDRVVSCGIDPDDGGLYMVTGIVDVRVLRPNGRRRPASAYPSHDGRLIGLTFHGDDALYVVESTVALKDSESCFTTLTSLSVNDTYMGDLEFEAVFPPGDAEEMKNHEDETK